MTLLRMRATIRGVVADGADPDADFIILPPGPTGLGPVAPRSGGDQEVTGADGSVAGVDYRGPRIVSVPYLIKRIPNETPDPEAALAALRVLSRAWATDHTDDEVLLSLWLPGYGPSDDVVRFYGRPRTNLSTDLRGLYAGVVYALGVFEALDPLAYGPAVVTAGSSTISVDNDGDVATDRATLTLTGSGGTPVISNPDDGGGSIAWSSTLANAAVRVINLRNRTVVDAGGVDRSSEVATASTWWTLQQGVNDLSLTGAASLSVSHQPAYN